jgi:hypothetical protein
MKNDQWHDADGDPYKAIVDHAETMRRRQQPRIDRYRAIARAAGLDSVLFGAGSSNLLTMGTEGMHGGRARHPTNILAHLIESLQADVFKNRIIPMAVTDRGNFRQRKRAKLLNQFLEGVFEENDFDILQLRAGLMALYFGDAIIKGECPNRRVKFVCVPPWEVLVDDLEARYGTPCTYVHCYLVDRRKLLSAYGKAGDFFGTIASRRDAIKAAPAERDLWLTEDAIDSTADMVMVYEAWHIASGEDADDGRHVLCLKTGTLCDYEYKADQPPLRWLRSQTPLAGIWDLDSVAWRILPNQQELTFLDRRIRESVATVGVPRIYASRASKVKVEHFNDWVGSILVGDGPTPPQSLDWTPIHPEVLQHRQSVKAEMYEMVGGNNLQANAQLPSGSMSGKAIDTTEDIFSARHAVKHRLLEQLVVSCSELAIDIISELAEEDGGYEVRTTGQSWLKKIDWKEVEIDREEFVLKTFPISWLSRLPGKRFKQLQELLQAEIIDTTQFRQLWQMPDLDAEDDLENATADVVDETLDKIAFSGVYLSPEGFDDLDLCIRRGRKFYNWLRLQSGVPEDALMLVAQFIDECVALQAPPPEAAPPPGLPPGPEAAMPPAGAPPMPEGMPPGMPPMPGGAPPMVS